MRYGGVFVISGCGIYIHVPFCARKCGYCDFYSRPFDEELAARYLDALLCQLGGIDRRAAATVYFGGGTPSLLSAADVGRVVDAVARRLDLAADAEITLELNPETATSQKLRAWRAAGVNRLSVGVQTLNDDTLRAIGRGHTAAQARDTLLAAREAGFGNVSADVMLGLPGEDIAALGRTLDSLLALPLAHVSAYLLKLMPGTPMGDVPPAGLPDDDSQAALYEYGVARLNDAGLYQYEISNFARPGRQSRHNRLYWDCGDYYGLGPAAHSSIDGRRYSCPSDLDTYMARYQSGRQPFIAPLDYEGDVTAADYTMLQLRMTDGLSLSKLYDLYNFRLNEQRIALVRQYRQAGLLAFDGETLRLTVQGMLLSNSIMAALI